jgi:hypothetical protein
LVDIVLVHLLLSLVNLWRIMRRVCSLRGALMLWYKTSWIIIVVVAMVRMGT